ncbi:hypothetical protein Tco_1131220 [Tanacetum coccineum]
MADHSRNWYDEATTKERIEGSSDDVDIKQHGENIHVFQVSSKTCEGMHLTEECTLRKEDKAVEQNKYMRSLEETIIKFCEDSIKEQAADDKWIRKFIENTKSNIRAHKTTTKNLNPSRTHKTVCMMGILEEIHKIKAHEDEGNTDDGSHSKELKFKNEVKENVIDEGIEKSFGVNSKVTVFRLASIGIQGCVVWIHHRVGFVEFYKELEAEILGDGEQLMGLHFLQLELRLGKTPSRSFRPVKSAEVL